MTKHNFVNDLSDYISVGSNKFKWHFEYDGSDKVGVNKYNTKAY